MFTDIKTKVQRQFNVLKQHELFLVSLGHNELFDAYLDAFDPELRQEHNCSCCRHFLRNYGGIVAIVDDEVKTLWDFDVAAPYDRVPSTLAATVRNAAIDRAFLTKIKGLGTDFNNKLLPDKTVVTYEHFYVEYAPNVTSSESIATVNSGKVAKAQTTKRALDTITQDAVETVLELIAQNSIYRGQEFKASLGNFLKAKKKYDKLDERKQHFYAWNNYAKGLNIRNSSIGTLVLDISEGRDLNAAVGAFEAMVAPQNYKRPTALVTKAMIEKAEKELQAAGLEPALYRRYATPQDIKVNNLLFVDRGAKAKATGGLFEDLKADTPINPKTFDKVEEISLDTFIGQVIPTADSVEILVENKHAGNFMTLVAPQHADAPNLFKWDNGFSWAYADGLADSVKQRVKDAGGSVDGALRFSIQWNECGNNSIDFDAHAIEPDGHEIMFSNKGQKSRLSGMLDVDIISPGKNVAVENITWERLPIGTTELIVHNYSSRVSNGGFTAEIECEGALYEFTYAKNLRGNERVAVAKIRIDANGLKFISSMGQSGSRITSKEIWGVSTSKFHKVSMILNSPNHWDGQTAGNLHTFFIIDEVKSPVSPRGVFNEFLRNDLLEHKRVFELLGSKMKCPDSEQQLSGLGFSSTQNNSVTVRVTGKTTRILKVQTNV